ncbi:TonB-dependent receptor [Piscinibacter sakaiensis]|uniref:TonB-dependent receptor n=1 Tax=Piscinibacter sakaiensis TaxID=1547922 RepID=A0A0K8NTP0_PISS1|nr:TonB-dependent receptor [Piscinibacter sakaiensis]
MALACAALAALAAGGAAAQQPVTELERVEVIGATPLPGLAVPRSQVPAPVQTATGAALERSGALGPADFAARRLGSVFVNEIQNNPFQPDLNYRGFTASPLLGTPQGLSLYLDGVRLNQAFGDVVSWDLIPRSAIATMTLVPGSNPLYGLNTLGGALSVQTKDGLSHPGASVQLTLGTEQRRSGEFELGGSNAQGLDWFVTGQAFREDGWRQASPTRVDQLFAKVGWHDARTRVSLTAAAADTDLYGNGLQEIRLLQRQYDSVYTQPDQTENRATLLNLAFSHEIDRALSVTGNLHTRRIRTHTLNGDINEGALDQSVYTVSAAERAALTRAGITVPTTPINAANTPFPFLRCIGQGLLNDEPGEKCNGLLNRSATSQTQSGLSGQLNWKGQTGGVGHQAVLGAAVETSRVDFRQTTQLGYLNPDHSVTGIDSFADGVTGGDVDGVPFDNRVDLRSRSKTWSVYLADTLSLGAQTHLTLSGRYNRSTVRNRDQIVSAPDPTSLDGDHRFSRFNPAVGLTWTASKAFQVYAGYNEGSRAPTAVELGCANPDNPCKLPNALAGDPPLKQVVTKTLEAGLRGALPGGGQWQAGVFRATNHDDLLFVAAPSANGFGYFKNFGKTRRQGVELAASTRVGPAQLSVSYTWLDATYRSAEEVNGAGNSSNEEGPGLEGEIEIRPGDRIPLVPRQMLKLGAEIDLTERWALDLDVIGMAGVYARGNENNQHQPDGTTYVGPGRTGGYGVLNLGTSFQPARGLKLFARVNNVFDRKYATAAQLGATGFDANGNFQARPFPQVNGEYPLQGSTFVAPGAPRSVVVGLRYTFF